MSERASPTLIGAFVIGALGVLIAGLLILGGGRLGGDRETLALFFRTDTSGLKIGAPVVLKGVQIGMVTDIGVTFDEERGAFIVPVYIEIDQDRVDWPGEIRGELNSKELYEKALQAGMRARLGSQSLVTGMLQIEVGFFPGTPLILYGRDPRYRELPTIASPFERLRGQVEKIPLDQLVEQAVAVLDGLRRLVDSPEMPRILASLEAALEDLAAASAEARNLMGSSRENLDATLTDARRVARVLAQRLDGLLLALEEAAAGVRGAIGSAGAEVGPAAQSLRRAADSARVAFLSAKETFDNISSAVDEGSPLRHEALVSLRALSAAARSLKDMADYLERHPESLIRGKR
jgi:paraquat-inducible protein B